MAGAGVPVTVIGGYLGAGKTTLVNHVLANSGGRRIAVLVNDFGEVNIDARLILERSADTISLTNGCVCCSLSDGLAAAMAELARSEPPYDHVVIEVSGVGDPWKVAQWGRTPGFQLDGVVVLAAADAVVQQLADRYIGETIDAQLARADLVVISRSDLVVDHALRDVTRELEGRTSAPILVARPDRLSLSVLLGRGEGPGLVDGSAVAHPTHLTRSIRPGQRVTASDLEAWLRMAPDGIWRVKGFMACSDRAEPLTAVQKVGPRVELDAAPADLMSAEAILVAIASPGVDDPTFARWLASAPWRTDGP